MDPDAIGLIETLEKEPNESSLRDVLTKLTNNPPATRNDTLKLVLVLLSTTVPQVYWQIPDLRGAIATCCLSLIGLGNIMARIDLARKTKQDEYLRSLVDVLVRVCSRSVMIELLKDASRMEVTEVDRLFFKGKAFTITAELNREFVDGTIFASIDAYLAFLTSQIGELFRLDSDYTVQFVLSAVSFHPDFSGHLFNMLFTQENWGLFNALLNRMKLFQRRRLLEPFWSSFIAIKLKRNSTKIHIDAIAYIIHTSSLAIPDAALVDNIINTINPNICRIAAYQLSDQDSAKGISQLQLRKWGSESIIKHESIALQQIRTIFIILLIKYQAQLSEGLLRDLGFINAVSNRLGAFSDQVKNLALELSNAVCDASGQERIFKDYVSETDTCILNPEFESVDAAWDALRESVVETEPDVIESEMGSLQLDVTNYNDDESDYTSDDEDPTIRKKAVAKPLYVKDLLAYLRAETKDPAAYEKRKMALECGPTLIRQKLTFGSELRTYTEQLLMSLVALTNDYEEKHFEEARLSCMIAVASSDPSLGVILVELLAGGDYSLQQRITILSTISFAVREQGGVGDEFVKKSFTIEKFPTKQLPMDLHRRLAPDVNSEELNTAYRALEDELMHDASEMAKDELAGGKILRMSSRVKSVAQKLTAKAKNFHKIVGPKYFFPLVNLWHHVDGIDIGHYSSVLTSHYLRTLSLMLHAAYPTSVDLKDMTRELMLVVASTLRAATTDQTQLIESIFTAVLLVLDITDAEILIHMFSNELQTIQVWTSSVWEKLIDEKLKSLGAGVLIRLQEMTEKYQRTLMGQMNSTF